MKSLFLSIIFLFSFSFLSGQCTTNENQVKKVTIDKNGKMTMKECLFVTICENVVEFRISHTSIQTFHHLEGSVWVDHADKVVRVTREAGVVTFTRGKSSWSYAE